jgi:hypothetical protein
MQKTFRLMVVCALMLSPGFSSVGERFDGNWMTKLVCPPKGSTEGYTWNVPSVVSAGSFHGERGKAGEPGYLLIEGKIKEDGSAKLTANGIVASRKYARGVFAAKGEEYGYDIKAQFSDTEGTGARNQGLGIVGRACTFEFVKLQAPAKMDDNK